MIRPEDREGERHGDARMDWIGSQNLQWDRSPKVKTNSNLDKLRLVSPLAVPSVSSKMWRRGEQSYDELGKFDGRTLHA